MKTLIHEVEEESGHNYQLYAELIPLGQYNQIKFTTIWDGAIDPKAEQRKFEAFLSIESVNKLIKVLETANGLA